MKCKICETDFDTGTRTPRNLNCGHTFCELCLKLYMKGEEIECPRCTKKSHYKLPICYAIFDMIHSEENYKKIEYCISHPVEKLQFKCQVDDETICSICLLQRHNGHVVISLKGQTIGNALLTSVSEIKKDMDRIRNNLESKKEIFQKFKSEIEKSESLLVCNYREEKKKLSEFENQFLNKKKEKLEDFSNLIINNYKKQSDTINNLVSDLNSKSHELKYYSSKIDEMLDSLGKNSISSSVANFNLIKTEDEFRKFKNQIDNFKIPEEKINEYFIEYEVKDLLLEKTIKIDNVMCEKNENFNSIIFLGDSKDKLIISFNLETEQWHKIEYTNFNIFDFQDYSATARFDNGEILITGGCIYTNFRHTAQKSVYKAKIQPSGDVISFTGFRPMNINRFSHGLLIIKDIPYVFGGHDGNETLSSLECYNSMERKWNLMSFMNIEREIFAYCAVKDRYIYVFGGFNLNHLDSIERYDTVYDKWKLLNIKMKRPLQNASAVTISNERIILIGGYNGALHKCVDILDLSTKSWISVEYMQSPRRKAHPFKYKNKIYIFGGESTESEIHIPEIYDLVNNTWQKGKSFDSIISKSLNFWSSTTIYI